MPTVLYNTVDKIGIIIAQNQSSLAAFIVYVFYLFSSDGISGAKYSRRARSSRIFVIRVPLVTLGETMHIFKPRCIHCRNRKPRIHTDKRLTVRDATIINASIFNLIVRLYQLTLLAKHTVYRLPFLSARPINVRGRTYASRKNCDISYILLTL